MQCADKQKRVTKSIPRLLDVITITVLIAVFLIACNGCGNGGNGEHGENGNGVDISMIAPYVNESDMASVDSAFSLDNNSPWGDAHSGIDFFPNGNLKPFQAVSSGVVDDIDLSPIEGGSNWQVIVTITYDSTYSVIYVFEPMTAVEADGETQLTNISVSVGQAISQGDIIGYLYTPDVNEGAHVHFGLFTNGGGTATCPEPYFTQEAIDSILILIRIAWADANMCY